MAKATDKWEREKARERENSRFACLKCSNYNRMFAFAKRIDDFDRLLNEIIEFE